jgi:septation ring formation regulator EzrA
MTTGDIIGIAFFVVLFVIATGFGLWLQRAENERIQKQEEKKA